MALFQKGCVGTLGPFPTWAYFLCLGFSRLSTASMNSNVLGFPGLEQGIGEIGSPVVSSPSISNKVFFNLNPDRGRLLLLIQGKKVSELLLIEPKELPID